MSVTQFNSLAVLALFVTIFVSGFFLKWGRKHLTAPDRQELSAMGPDVIGLALMASVLALGYLGPRLHVWTMVGAVILGGAGIVRVLSWTNRESWQRSARIFLSVNRAGFIGDSFA